MKRLVALAAIALLLSGCAQQVDPQVKQAQDVYWDTFLFFHPDADVERPDVSVIKVVTDGNPDDELIKCMTDAGYEVTRNADGGFEIDGGVEADLAMYVCKASYPWLMAVPTNEP